MTGGGRKQPVRFPASRPGKRPPDSWPGWAALDRNQTIAAAKASRAGNEIAERHLRQQAAARFPVGGGQPRGEEVAARGDEVVEDGLDRDRQGAALPQRLARDEAPLEGAVAPSTGHPDAAGAELGKHAELVVVPLRAGGGGARQRVA